MYDTSLFFTIILCSFIIDTFGNIRIQELLSNDFFALTNVRLGSIFACHSPRDMVSLAVSVSKTSHISVAVKDLNSPIFDKQDEVVMYFNKMFGGISTFQTGIVLDMSCSKSQEVINIAGDMELFDSTHHWLLIGGEDSEKYFQVLKSAGLRIDNSVFLACKNDEFDYWSIFDVYNTGYKVGGSFKFTLYALWSANAHFGLTNSTNMFGVYASVEDVNAKPSIGSRQYYASGRWRLFIFEDKISRRKDLGGLVLKAGMAITSRPPKGGFLKYISSTKNIAMDTMHRHNYAQFLLLMDIFNFRLKVIRTNNWGIIKNGTWTGAIGILVNKMAEFSITPTQFKEERITIVDQTAIGYVARATIMFRHPRDTGVGDGFAKPLSTSVWYSSLGVIILSTIILKVAFHQEARMVSDQIENANEAKEDDSWSYTLLIAITGVFCQQGFPHTPNICSGRTMAYLWLSFTFLLFQFYSASIVSSLLSEPPRTINSLKDVVNSKLKVVIEDIAYNWDFFDSTTDPIAQELYRKKVAVDGGKPNYVTPAKCLERVKQGGYACQIDVATAYKLIPGYFGERAICDLAEVQLFSAKPVITVVRRGSPYRQMITYGIRKIHESGIMQYQKAVWVSPKPMCTLGGASETVSVALPETSTAFILLLISYLVSLLILSVERCIFKNKRLGKSQKRRKRRKLPYT